mmetsp:Transcript_23502/g.35712  ORF Transcript_23502/g.35712 Transcript_23502/m.35712 type:complete len:661 (-) Transcript_23502:69-2051(-)
MPRKRHESFDHLLNFRTAIPENPFEADRSSRKSRKQLEAERQEARTREKLRSSFYLYASSSHAFVISRRSSGGGNIPKKECKVANNIVDWETVRIVKQLCPIGSAKGESSSLTTCSICLSDFVAARITKCGHAFCYPCILRHMHSSSASEGDSNLMAKCPCCSTWIQQKELRPVEFISVQSPSNKMGKAANIIEFKKLFRYQGSTAPYLPFQDKGDSTKATVSIDRRVEVNDIPTVSERGSQFVRTNYVDTTAHQLHLLNNIEALEQEVKSVTLLYQNTKGSNEASCSQDKYFIEMSIEVVKCELSDVASSWDEENRLRKQLERAHDKHKIEILPYCTEIEKADAAKRANVGEKEVTKTDDTEENQKGKLEPGMMYANDDCVQFYQAADGQLSFLSAFNFNCLNYEFAAKDPVFEHQLEDCDENISRKPPFPDTIRSTVIEVEKIHLTADMQKRMKCFAHLPLCTDISMVELDLNHLLSNNTRLHFKKDFERRKKKRQAKRDAEKKADREARMKEDVRIEELKKGIQRIDPNDTFFHAPTEPNIFDEKDYEHSLSGVSILSPNPDSGTRMNFSSACLTESALPQLNTTDTFSFPSLSSPSSAFPALPSVNPAPNSLANHLKKKEESKQSLKPSTAVARPSSSRKKKTKGRVLFSTGGHRS